jgi:hypothetical protein
MSTWWWGASARQLRTVGRCASAQVPAPRLGRSPQARLCIPSNQEHGHFLLRSLLTHSARCCCGLSNMAVYPRASCVCVLGRAAQRKKMLFCVAAASQPQSVACGKNAFERAACADFHVFVLDAHFCAGARGRRKKRRLLARRTYIRRGEVRVRLGRRL